MQPKHPRRVSIFVIVRENENTEKTQFDCAHSRNWGISQSERGSWIQNRNKKKN